MTVFRRFVIDRWRADAWWALGIVAMALVNMAFYPGIKGDAELDKTVADLPPALKAMFGIESGISIGSAAGYIQAQVFSSLMPILLLVLAIGLGSGAVGGSEEDGSLEFLLSQPVSRRSLLVGRAFGVMAVLALHTVIVTVSMFAICPMFGALEGVDRVGLAAECVGCGALAMLHAGIAFTAGAWLGRRTPAIAISSAVAAGGYMALGLFSAINAPTAVRYLTPWYWFLKQNLMVTGANAVVFLPALLLALVATALAIPVFLRRDIQGR
ncbi:MAG: ABC transporter permease subunit [Dehalococcoidia bacterium]